MMTTLTTPFKKKLLTTFNNFFFPDCFFASMAVSQCSLRFLFTYLFSHDYLIYIYIWLPLWLS